MIYCLTSTHGAAMAVEDFSPEIDCALMGGNYLHLFHMNNRTLQRPFGVDFDGTRSFQSKLPRKIDLFSLNEVQAWSVYRTKNSKLASASRKSQVSESAAIHAERNLRLRLGVVGKRCISS